MKKVLLGLTVAAVMSLGATEIGENMKNMRDGLIQIQDGFLYNQKSNILAGITKVEETNKKLHNKKFIASFLPEAKKGFLNIALISSKSLSSNLAEMREYVNHDQFTEASSANAVIVRNCTRCHAVVRGW